MSLIHLLMIEDDHRLASMVANYLRQNACEVVHVETASDGLAILENSSNTLSLLILDLMLPDADGLEVCRQIRASQSAVARIPILMLTAKGDPIDRVLGLELGADDYLPKPFEPRELLARVRAMVRRASTKSHTDDSTNCFIRIGALSLDIDARRVYLHNKERQLTAYQFDLLQALAEGAGRVLSRDMLMDAVKGQTLLANDRSIDVHIGRIRMIIEDDPRNPTRILTVRGAGYTLVRDPT